MENLLQGEVVILVAEPICGEVFCNQSSQASTRQLVGWEKVWRRKPFPPPIPKDLMAWVWHACVYFFWSEFMENFFAVVW